MVHDLIFPHEGELYGPGSVLTVDNKYGQAATVDSDTLKYSGRCRVSQDHEAIRRLTQGSDLDVDTLVYLPPGEVSASIDDVWTMNDGAWVGRVRMISDFTQEYYTRLLVKRDA